MKTLKILALALFISMLSTTFATAQESVTSPIITKARFDAAGKLIVKVQEFGPVGCYISVNGGLKSTSIETSIIAHQVTASDLLKDTYTFKTKRKYYCRRRTLHIQLEKVCLNDVIGSANSEARTVSVPSGNLR